MNAMSGTPQWTEDAVLNATGEACSEAVEYPELLALLGDRSHAVQLETALRQQARACIAQGQSDGFQLSRPASKSKLHSGSF